MIDPLEAFRAMIDLLAEAVDELTDCSEALMLGDPRIQRVRERVQVVRARVWTAGME